MNAKAPIGWFAMAWAATAPAFDGTLDTSFGSAGQLPLVYQMVENNVDQGLTILHDSLGRRIVIVVRRNPFPLAPGRPLELILFRYLANGAPDSSFGFGTGQVRAPTDWTEFRGALVDAQNRIVVVGTIVDGAPALASLLVLRLTADGNRDSSFDAGLGGNGISGFAFGTSTASRAVAVALLPNNDLVYASDLDDGNGNVILRRISGVNGAPVESWGLGGGLQIVDLQPSANAARDSVVGLAALPDGRVLLLARSCTTALGCLPAAAQLTAATGQLDTTFCASTACINASVAGANRGRRVVRNLQFEGQTVTQMTPTVALRDPAGRLVFGGRATLASGAAAPLLFLRLAANGDLDGSFGAPATPGFQGVALPGVPLAASALLRDGSGRLLVAGDGERAGLRRMFVARLSDNGLPDASFGGGSALVEYFANPAAEDRAARALAFDGAQILGLGDFNGSVDRDAFLFRLGGSPDVLLEDGFEG